jgi:PAS domain S-box-containing protein
MRTSQKKKTAVTLTPTEAILESISDGVFTVDLEWRITSFNRAAEEITGIPRGEAIGRRCSDVFRSSMCEVEALRSELEGGSASVSCQAGVTLQDRRLQLESLQ